MEILKNIYRKCSARSSAEESEEQQLSPLQVHIPLHLVAESTKEKLRVFIYDDVCENKCVVCLTAIEGGDEVRDLPNCRHVFHMNCIDAWIQSWKTTCPVCRSDLFPGRPQGQKDPWRRERMIYLFGQDSFN